MNNRKTFDGFTRDELRSVPVSKRLTALSQLIDQFIKTHEPYTIKTCLEIFHPKNICFSFQNTVSTEIINLKNKYDDHIYFYGGGDDFDALIGLISKLFPEKVDQYYKPPSPEQSIFVKAIHLIYKELSDKKPALNKISQFCKLLSESIPKNKKELAQLVAKAFETDATMDHIYMLTQENGFYDQIPSHIKEEIESYSKSDLYRLDIHAADLAKEGLLNLDSFMIVIGKINLRFTKPNKDEVDISKTKTKINTIYNNKSKQTLFYRAQIGKITSKFVTESAQVHIYKEINPEADEIRRHLRVRRSLEQIYKSKSTPELEEESAFRAAIKETKYCNNPDAFYFEKNSLIAAVFPFIEGDLLSSLDMRQFKFKKRLIILHSLLEKINALHGKYRIHGDLFPRNVMINAKTSEAFLFDYETTHRPGASFINRDLFASMFTTQIETKYLYASESVFEKSIFNEFFPDYLNVTEETDLDIFDDIPSLNSFFIIQIYKKYFSYEQCNTQRLLTFTKELIEKYDTIRRAELNNIANEMLFGSRTVEDVIRASL